MKIMPFGVYQGTPLDMVPRDYLVWVHGSTQVSDRLREQIGEVLCPDNACCTGPAWWYRQRGRTKA
jgi:hypothetical protein